MTAQDGEGRLRSTPEAWDEKYSSRPALWSGRVNATLVEFGSDLEPGTAVDVGCGEGGDAVWLAERGWRVAGIDLSAVALGRADAAARARGIAERCAWVRGDVVEDASLAEPADLVTCHYLHEPEWVRRAAWQALALLVAPQGTLLIVGHHPDDEAPPGRGPRDRSVLFAPDEVAGVLAPQLGLKIVLAETRELGAETEDGPVTRRDSVVVARRSA